jgi:beta-glucosidase
MKSNDRNSARTWAGVTARIGACVALAALASSASAHPGHGGPHRENPDAWAKRIEAQMTDDERFSLLTGVMPIPLPIPGLNIPIPEGSPITAGFIPGIPRLGVPPQISTDASLGVVNPLRMRPGDVATAMPSGLALASSFDPGIAYFLGTVIGGEARAKGFNILLGGGTNLARDPRNGRNFEYLGEDPLLAGRMVGSAIRGVQSRGVVSTIKHYALNGQETQRFTADSVIDENALRESELLAFQIGIEIGQPGSVMCAYNLVNGAKSCGNDFLLNRVLKQDWGYKGWVMSDWGAVDDVSFFMRGLDQQSGHQLDRQVWFGAPLRKLVDEGKVPHARVADAVQRILRSFYAVGAEKQYSPTPIDYKSNAQASLDAARNGIVLLKNDGVLPLAKDAKNVLVVGGNADFGVLSGAGSSQVAPSNGPPRLLDVGGDGLMGAWNKMLFMPSSPLKHLRGILGEQALTFETGYSPAAAVVAAKRADLVIVFATKWEAEGMDSGSMALPQGQDPLIRDLTAVNRNVVVVLETGNPVTMPWVNDVRAIVQAWYPGQEGGQAIAEVLTGRVNPSGRLPITFPASLEQTPRGEIPGLGLPERTPVKVEYREGAESGYRWFAKQGERPLFAFGHGLSYTTFEHSALTAQKGAAKAEPVKLSFTVRNTGSVAGADVPQVYLVERNGEKLQRLVGFQRVSLQPGDSGPVTVAVDERLLGQFTGNGWKMPAGRYTFAVGKSAADLGPRVEIELAARTRKP